MRIRAIVALIFAAWVVSAEDARASAWLPPVDLASGAIGPSTAEATPGGETIIAWTKKTGGTYTIQTAVRPPGGSFGPAADLTPPGDIIDALDLAIDPRGNALLTWRQLIVGNDIRLYFSERPAGGSFSPPVEVSSAGTHVAQPRTGMDAAGNAITIFRRAPGSDQHIAAVYKPAGAGYGPQEEIAGHAASNPALAVALDGSALASWTTEPGGALEAARRPQGGDFGPIQPLVPKGVSGLESAVAPSGRAVLSWSHYDGTESLVEGSVAEPGGVYGPPKVLSTPGFYSEVSVGAMDSAGTALVAWTDGGPGTSLRVATAPPGGALTAAPSPAADAYPYDAEFLPDGGLFLAYAPEGNEPYPALVSLRSPGGQFDPALTLSQPGEDSRMRDLDGDGAGNMVALYIRREDPVNSILRIRGFDGVAPALRSLTVPTGAKTGVTASFSADVFDAFGSTVEWRFGDGSSTAGPVVKHTYRDTGGRRTITVTATDPAGQATTETRIVEVKDVTPVTVTKVKFKPASFAAKSGGAHSARVKKGSKLRYRLSEPARVRITVERKRTRNGKTAFVKLRLKPLATRGKKGGNRARFSGRGLAPGRYRAALVATDGGGLKSKTKYAPFTIVSP